MTHYLSVILLALGLWGSGENAEMLDIIEHDLRMSRCDIDYRADAQSYEISIRIFIDDLELDLASRGHDSLKLCTKHEKANAEELIHDYLIDNLLLEVDGDLIELNWVGKEMSEDLSAVWCYLEGFGGTPSQSFQITNGVLLSQFDDQQNIVKIVMEDAQKSFFLFDNDEYTGSVDIK